MVLTARNMPFASAGVSVLSRRWRAGPASAEAGMSGPGTKRLKRPLASASMRLIESFAGEVAASAFG